MEMVTPPSNEQLCVLIQSIMDRKWTKRSIACKWFV